MHDEEKTTISPTDWLFAKSKKAECDICKKKKTVAFVLDPIVEVEPRELWECYDCFTDRLYDSV